MSEKSRLKAMREGLFQAFPNPERKGCPGPDTMRGIVAGRIALAEENKWIDHFILCSPCSKEFYEIRCSHIRNKRLRAGVVASLVVLIVALGVWGWVHHQEGGGGSITVAHVGTVSTFRKQVLDLRNWSGERADGGIGGIQKAPLELHHWRTSLVIYLPLGSESGNYEIQILERSKTLLQVDGVARTTEGKTILRVRADLSKLKSGQYTLGIRQPPWDWRYHSLTIQ